MIKELFERLEKAAAMIMSLERTVDELRENVAELRHQLGIDQAPKCAPSNTAGMAQNQYR